MIENVDQVYDYVERAIGRLEETAHQDIANELRLALRLGSSGLEILGAINHVLTKNSTTVDLMTSPAERQAIQLFVRQSFGAAESSS